MIPADPPAPSSRSGASGLHVVHLVRTANFAGVERYLSYLGPAQVDQGLDVTIVGGDSRRMKTALAGTGVHHLPSSTIAADLKAVAGSHPTLIHAHMTDAEVVAALAKLRRRTPVVATLHFAKPRGRDAIRRTLFGPLPRLLDAQIAISQFVVDRSGERSATVIPNGIPWDQPAGDRQRTVLVTQRLEAEKDTGTAVRAWASSGLASQGWQMEIAGGGAMHASISDLTRQLGVSDTVTLLGSVDDIPERQARAGIFLATAPAEPFGLAVVEAMAAGTPVVAAAGGAHLETVGRVTHDHLFRASDADAAALALRRLADDGAEQTVYGDALRAEYRRSFTIEHHVEQVLEVYEQVVTKRSSP